MNKPQYVIGIDPGKHTGFAVYDRHTRQLIDLRTSTFWTTVFDLERYLEDCGALNFEVVIEDVTQLKAVFQKQGDGSSRKREHIAQGVGSVKRDAELLIQFIEAKGIRLNKMVPRKGGTSKMKVEAFNALTKWNKSSSEHSRDAAMLVFGR